MGPSRSVTARDPPAATPWSATTAPTMVGNLATALSEDQVSDTAQGPGWWVASDGNWYPPDQHPDHLARLQAPATSLPVAATQTEGRSPSDQVEGPAIDMVPPPLRRTPLSGGAAAAVPVWRRWWVWVLCAMAVVVVVGADIKASQHSPPASGAGAGSGATGGGTSSANSTSLPPTSVPGPAAADVTVTACVVDPNDPALVDIAGQVRNSTPQAQDYNITVTILSGSQMAGTAGGLERGVAAGQTSDWSLFGAIGAGHGGKLTCRVTGVNRTPSSP